MKIHFQCLIVWYRQFFPDLNSKRSCLIQAHFKINSLPTGVPQDLVSVLCPEHPAPHSLPAIQDLVRVCVPEPHCTEHALQAPYPVHRELTEKECNRFIHPNKLMSSILGEDCLMRRVDEMTCAAY